MERLFGLLELRAVNDELREFEGIANTGALDADDSIVEPEGARFTLPMPLLWQHDQKTPVGEITEAKLVNDQWLVKGTIAKVKEAGKVKDATDQAWHSVKYKLVRGLSIGFQTLKKKGNRFIEWAWRELSLVTIPSNQEATIFAVRSAYLAASGDSPGVSGPPTTTPRLKMPMTYEERITALEARHGVTTARMDAINDKVTEEGRTKDESEQEEYETLERDAAALIREITDLKRRSTFNLEKATPVSGNGTKPASDSRNSGRPNIRVRANTEPGIGMARLAMAYVQARGNVIDTENIIRQRWPDQASEMLLEMRAVVAPGTSTDATWAGPLVQPSTLASEFLEYLRPRTVLGKIQGLRRPPMNTRIPSQTGTGTYGWVGERVPKPLTSLAFAATTLPYHKIAGIIVLTEELVRFSSPSAEALVRDDMVSGIANFVDAEFLGAAAASAGVRPAGIRNGLAANNATGTTEAAARTDIRALISGFAGSLMDLSGVVIVMQETTAFTLGTIVNSVGGQAFPGLGLTGGVLFGAPVVTSQNAALSGIIVALHAPSIAVGEDGPVTIDLSREASLQFESAPTNPPDATTVFRSLWQENLVGLRADRYITWLVLRSGAVRHITAVAYA